MLPAGNDNIEWDDGAQTFKWVCAFCMRTVERCVGLEVVRNQAAFVIKQGTS